jgi:peptidoglycan LD-endopeptidase CwlK
MLCGNVHVMPANLLARIDLDLLYAPFLEKLLDMLADCQVQQREYVATLGYRTWVQQDEYYAQGRTRPGPIITNARGGESAHNYGIAVDFFASKPHAVGTPAIPDWTPGAYDLLGQMAKLRGLEWGGDWGRFPDRPHVQWPGYDTAVTLAPLRAAYLQDPAEMVEDKLHRVWSVLDGK